MAWPLGQQVCHLRVCVENVCTPCGIPRWNAFSQLILRRAEIPKMVSFRALWARRACFTDVSSAAVQRIISTVEVLLLQMQGSSYGRRSKSVVHTHSEALARGQVRLKATTIPRMGSNRHNSALYHVTCHSLTPHVCIHEQGS
jgi:hypothetical protein